MGPWLDMYRALKSELVQSSGLAGTYLQQADGADGETLELFMILDGVVAEERGKQRQSQRL
jgi:glycine cleavage system protein P-like pyridoxal-binding family